MISFHSLYASITRHNRNTFPLCDQALTPREVPGLETKLQPKKGFVSCRGGRFNGPFPKSEGRNQNSAIFKSNPGRQGKRLTGVERPKAAATVESRSAGEGFPASFRSPESAGACRRSPHCSRPLMSIFVILRLRFLGKLRKSVCTLHRMRRPLISSLGRGWIFPRGSAAEKLYNGHVIEAS